PDLDDEDFSDGAVLAQETILAEELESKLSTAYLLVYNSLSPAIKATVANDEGANAKALLATLKEIYGTLFAGDKTATREAWNSIVYTPPETLVTFQHRFTTLIQDLHSRDMKELTTPTGRFDHGGRCMDLDATPTTNIPNINMLLDEMPAAETRANAGASTSIGTDSISINVVNALFDFHDAYNHEAHRCDSGVDSDFSDVDSEMLVAAGGYSNFDALLDTTAPTMPAEDVFPEGDSDDGDDIDDALVQHTNGDMDLYELTEGEDLLVTILDAANVEPEQAKESDGPDHRGNYHVGNCEGDAVLGRSQHASILNMGFAASSTTTLLSPEVHLPSLERAPWLSHEPTEISVNVLTANGPSETAVIDGAHCRNKRPAVQEPAL
ncbi:hypothetical protein HK101_004846, partial [Irineochytrium annulatum]